MLAGLLVLETLSIGLLRLCYRGNRRADLRARSLQRVAEAESIALQAIRVAAGGSCAQTGVDWVWPARMMTDAPDVALAKVTESGRQRAPSQETVLPTK